jgi:predicted alpha/beta hydrolase family esterase
MKQILVIHGGTTFPSYQDYRNDLESSTLSYDRLLAGTDWKRTLKQHFPDDDILLPSFPSSQNAQYDEWVIVFEKILPLLHDDVILVGHSLGAIFLAKYLHDHTLSKPVSKLILVAAPYNDESLESLGAFKLTSAQGIERSAHQVHFFYSEDDPIVSINEREKFMTDVPAAQFHTFPDRQHFWQETFPELVELIKK